MHERKVILYIAMSLDGFIAKPNDDLSFLSIVEKDGEDYGYGAFTATIDTVIIGRKTYDWVVKAVGSFPHKDTQTYVITLAVKPQEGKITFYNGSLQALVKDLRSKPGKNIFVDGGAEIVNELIKDGLIDEFYLSIIPIILGEGVRLFQEHGHEQRLRLESLKQFETGLAQLHYTRI